MEYRLNFRVKISAKTAQNACNQSEKLHEGVQLFSSGRTRVVLGLPEGVIQSVTGRMFLPLDRDEKIFMNGFQSWTHCPENDRSSRIRGLQGIPLPAVKHFSLDRYGDYNFTHYPYQRGITHGWSYCYFRKGDHYRLIGSLGENAAYTAFRYDARNETLSLRRDCAGLQCGGTYTLFDLFYAEGTEDEVFDAYFAALGVKPRTERRLAGYSSWYNRYANIAQAPILSDLSGCKTLLAPGDLFQIDDGWQQAVGDWQPDWVKFPDGMKAMADAAHEAGFLAGLWLAPFGVQKDSKLYRLHPDWVLHKDGKPWLSGCNWGGFYSLDIDKPEVVAYLESVFHRVLHEWGFDLVKLDFLYGVAPFGSSTETRGARMRRALELLRRICGDKLILGCGVPLAPAFGLVDYCRIGPDVSLDWNDKAYMQIIHRERVSTRHSIHNTLFRRQLNGRAFLNDPDVFYLRDENCFLTAEEKTLLAEVNTLFSGILLTSDNPVTYNLEKFRRYAELKRLKEAETVRVEADGGVCVRYTLDGEERLLWVET